MKTLMVTHLMLGPLLLVIALLTRIFPPKKINNFYGYRTPRSMRSEGAWKEANTYSTNAMIILAVSLSIFQLVTYLIADETLSLNLSVGFLLLGLIILIVITEHHLKRKGFN